MLNISFSQISNYLKEQEDASDKDKILFNINSIVQNKLKQYTPTTIFLVLDYEHNTKLVLKNNMYIYNITQKYPAEKNHGIILYYAIKYVEKIFGNQLKLVISTKNISQFIINNIENEKTKTIKWLDDHTFVINLLYYYNNGCFNSKWNHSISKNNQLFLLENSSYYSLIDLEYIYIEEKDVNNIKHLDIYLPIDREYIDTYNSYNLIYIVQNKSTPINYVSLHSFLKNSNCNIILLNKKTINYWWNRRTTLDTNVFFNNTYYYVYIKYTLLSEFGGIWMTDISFALYDMNKLFEMKNSISCIEFIDKNKIQDITIIKKNSTIPEFYLTNIDNLNTIEEQKEVEIIPLDAIEPFKSNQYVRSVKTYMDIVNYKSSYKFPLYFIWINDIEDIVSSYYNSHFKKDDSSLLTDILSNIIKHR